MQTPVAREILDQTTRCDHDFQCQTPQGEPYCSASRMMSGTLLRVHIGEGMQLCSYLVSYDGDHYCTCPTRIEIFKRYQA
jgi:hypothetical protein